MRIVVFMACLSLALAFVPGRFRHGSSRKLIVGGKEVKPGSRPYQVTLQSTSSGPSQFCGGTLVHKRWVVTAAHCAGGDYIHVGLGFHSVYDQGREVITGKFIVHPDYGVGTTNINNDIALIKLDADATLSSLVHPIRIASANSDVTSGMSLLTSGWGTLSAGGPLANELRQVVVQGVSRSDCQKDYSQDSVTDKMVCAKAPGKDACQGDSGGPIVSNFDEDTFLDTELLEGIVSWGYGCADPNYPGVYTRVSMFCSWIASETGGDVNC